MIRKISAPIVLIMIFIIISVLLNTENQNLNQITQIVTAIISVIVAYKIWPSSIIINSAALFTCSIIFPISVLYAIGNYDNLETPLSEILRYIEWPLMSVPFFSGLATAFFLKHLTQRSSRDRQNAPAP